LVGTVLNEKSCQRRSVLDGRRGIAKTKKKKDTLKRKKKQSNRTQAYTSGLWGPDGGRMEEKRKPGVGVGKKTRFTGELDSRAVPKMSQFLGGGGGAVAEKGPIGPERVRLREKDEGKTGFVLAKRRRAAAQNIKKNVNF